MQKTTRHISVLMILLASMLAFLGLMYYFDNKYTTKMPMPQDGVLSLSSALFSTDTPVFLIDGWEICDGVCTPGTLTHPSLTWIGEFSNYRRGSNPSLSPLGSSTYQLWLHYDGSPITAVLALPELFTDYVLWWDDTLVAEGSGSLRESILLSPGSHTLTLSVSADSGYYAGMYFPGALGTPRAMLRMERIQSAVYGTAILIPLVLALFCFGLWAKTGDALRWRFCLLCLSFALYLSHYFVQLWNLPFAHWWYLVEDIALYVTLYLAVTLMLVAGGVDKQWFSRPLRQASILVPILEVMLYLLTSVWDHAVLLHGIIQDAYRVFIIICLLWGGAKLPAQENGTRRLVLLADGALALGLGINLFASNLFEPIYTLWQFEWCALVMTGLFAAMMVEQNRLIIAENRTYQTHLEELVKERTEQLSCLLNERRAFFSDMAHDLKGPLFATGAFIDMIRANSVGLDNELRFYIEQVELSQKEMSRRVASLNELNAADRLSGEPELLEVDTLLQELYHIHNPEALVSGIHLIVRPAALSMQIVAPREKLLLAFENIIYNALRFTPKDGVITLHAKQDGGFVDICVSDTGCGIPSEELPHVFERFYMGHAGKSTGSGLGLYIARTIVTESSGDISVSSVPGEGACFTVSLPLKKD